MKEIGKDIYYLPAHRINFKYIKITMKEVKEEGMLTLTENYEKDNGMIYGDVTVQDGTGSQWRMCGLNNRKHRLPLASLGCQVDFSVGPMSTLTSVPPSQGRALQLFEDVISMPGVPVL